MNWIPQLLLFLFATLATTPLLAQPPHVQEMHRQWEIQKDADARYRARRKSDHARYRADRKAEHRAHKARRKGKQQQARRWEEGEPRRRERRAPNGDTQRGRRFPMISLNTATPVSMSASGKS